MRGGIRRGDIFLADLRPVMGSEVCGIRPVVVIQNDIGNYYSPTTIVAPLTTKVRSRLAQPTHVFLQDYKAAGVGRESIILAEQLRTLDKCRLRSWEGKMPFYDMEALDKALAISIGLTQRVGKQDCRVKREAGIGECRR